MKRFHDYLVGHHFLLYTDHKPLLPLLNEYHVTSPRAFARIHRWSLFLSAYECNLKFSRRGWPDNTGGNRPVPFFHAEWNLFARWMYTLGISCDSPSRNHKAVLEDLHEAHPGMTWMKSLDECLYGGLGLTETLKELFSYAINVRQVCHLHLLLPFNHGSGQPALSLDYILTMPGQCMARSASSLLMHTQNGLKQGLFPRRLRLLPLNYSAIHLLALDFHHQWLLTMRDQIIFQTKWHLAPNLTALSSGVKWSCGMRGTDHKERSTEGDRGHSE